MDNNQFLIFRTGGKAYGIEVLKIESIERIGNITRVPKSPEGTIGVMNLRGNIVPILSFREKIGLKRSEYSKEMRIIVLDDEEDRIGILVDQVLDVEEMDLDGIYTDEKIQGDDAKDFIRGAIRYNDDILVTILDSEKLTAN